MKISKAFRLLLCLFISVTISCTDTTEKSPNQTLLPDPTDDLPEYWADTIDSYFQTKFDSSLFNGTVLFASCGKVVFQKSYGYSDLKKKTPLSIYSNFQLASVSKPLTALAVLQLYEQGLIKLDDDIRNYIPELPYEGVTVRMLLTHKSGLFNYMYFCDRFWDSWTVPISNEEAIALICKKKPDRWFIPGMRYNYSNTGFMLLASLVERVSQQSFVYYMRDSIFLPAGMDSSYVFDACLTPEIKDNGVVGYRPSGRRAESSYLDGVVGDKGVYSNVLDLFKLDQILYTDSIISQKILKEAFEPQHERLHIDDNYGLGWRINSSDSTAKIVYHAGWWKGFKTQFVRVLPNQATVIVLSNRKKCKLRQSDLLGLMGF